jgi:hypothetical protein
MRSIVRKRLVALLSLAGLVGTTASATEQADKSSTAADTKQESQVKLDKANQKNSTTKGGQKITPEYTRHKKGQAEAETKSLHHDADVKGGKSLDAGSKDTAKMSKVSSENAAAKNAAATKSRKVGAESNASKPYEWIERGTKKGATQGQAAPKATPETPK